MNRVAHAVQVASLLLMLGGCVSHSGKFDFSPCAGCDFEPVNNLARTELALRAAS